MTIKAHGSAREQSHEHDSSVELLQKPLSVDALRAKVRELLERCARA